MEYIYILKSDKDGKRYIGRTSKSPDIRLREHNSNKSKFTRGHQPWKLIYYEKFQSKKESQAREKFLKSGKGREWLKYKLK